MVELCRCQRQGEKFEVVRAAFRVDLGILCVPDTLLEDPYRIVHIRTRSSEMPRRAKYATLGAYVNEAVA